MARSLAVLAVFGALACGNGGHPPAPAPTGAPESVAPSHSAPTDPGSIAAIARTTCVVRGGRVFCFGDPVAHGSYGHLGTATPQVLPGLDDVVEIALSIDHACVRRRSGAVACWGVLDDGTLGRETPAKDRGYEPRRVTAPETIANVTATQLAVGIGFSCAIVDGGAVACWGMNDSDALGHVGAGSLHPQPIAGIAHAVELRARGGGVCARLQSGDVWCWGDGLRRGGADPHELAKPRAVAEVSRAIKLAMTDEGPCVLRAGGKVVCEHNPLFEDSLDAVDVAYADGMRCALRASGEVACDDGDPSHAAVEAGVHDAVAIALGDGHACALERSGAVLCWGNNDAGQTASPFHAVVAGPSPVPGVHDAVRVAMAYDAACAIDRGGTAWCWGGLGGGELGIPTSKAMPYRPSAERVDGVTDAVAIVGGAMHFCVLTRRGTVTCWGDVTSQPCAHPVADDADDCPVPAAVPGLDDAIDLSASRDGTCAVRKTGAVVCWGNPSSLGFDLPDWHGEPRAMAGVAGAVRVFAGYRRNCVVRGDGTAACWGEDVTFEADAVRHSRERIAEISGVHDAIAIGRGQPDYALSRSGEIRAFDWGNSFVTGGRKLEIAPPLSPVLASDVERMAEGVGEACAVKRSGELVCWSYNDQPAAVGIPDAIDVALSEAHTTCAVRKTGEVACWGENTDGQCGIDPGSHVATPHLVEGLPPL